MSFYDEVIQKSPEYNSTGVCTDMDLLEPGTRSAVEALIKAAAAQGIELRVTETFRSQARQSQLYEQKKTQLKSVGCHNYGVAADFVVIKDGQAVWDDQAYFFLKDLAPAHGLIWGGNWGGPGAESDPKTFHDWDHVESIPVSQQPELFANTWYPAPPDVAVPTATASEPA